MRRHRRRTHRGIGALLVGAALLLVLPPLATAETPVTLDSSHVYDSVGALDDDEKAEVEDAAADLREETGIDLWVVYVSTFESPSSAADWANQTAEDNGLADDQYLLAVAVDARQYYLSASDAGPVSFDDIASIESDDIEPRLTDDDWAGAGVGAADGLARAAGASDLDTSGITDGVSRAVSTVMTVLVGILIVAVLVAIVLIVVTIVRRRRKRKTAVTASAPAGVPLAELEKQASRALVQADDAVRTAEQDLGFATAQYGEEAAASFRSELDQAKSSLTEGFTLKQQLDDEVPDSADERRAWSTRIVEICGTIDARFAEQEKTFEHLRSLEANAPRLVEEVAAALAGAEQRVPQATATLQELGTRYAQPSLAAVADNVAQANERSAFAREELDGARAALAAGDTGTAAVDVAAAERAVGQLGTLLDAVEKARAGFGQAEAGVQALLTDLGADIAAARAQPATAALAGVVASTESIVADARARLAAPPVDVLAVQDQLTRANQAMDAALHDLRAAEQNRQRAAAGLGRAIDSAQYSVTSAEQFITTRRGAIGETARTRLAEAGRALAEARAIAASDPETAYRRALDADNLAKASLGLAQTDVSRAMPPTGGVGYPGGFGGYSPGYRGSAGAGFAGALLGGLLSGGGGRPSPRPGRGGFGGGFSGGLGGGSRSRSRSGGGGFGGSRGRSGGRRSGGSRGRSGGGRF